MSDQPTPSPDTPTPSEPLWAKPGIGVYTLTIFGIAYIVSFFANDQGKSFSLLTGAVIVMATQVSSYYFGSSSGSTKKDQTIEKISSAPFVQIPPQSRPPT